jgi:membrane-associated phospholipid phosphatase
LTRFARIISNVFDGTWLSIPVLFAICSAVAGNVIHAIGWALLLILFIVLLPYSYLLRLFRKKELNDLHVPERRQRIKPLLITTVSYIFGLCFFILIGAPKFLICLIMIYLVSTAVFTLITLFWKISFHTSWITAIAVTFYVLFGDWSLFIVPLIPLVAWARIYLHCHTVMQVIMGTVVSAVITLSLYMMFGFLEI